MVFPQPNLIYATVLFASRYSQRGVDSSAIGLPGRIYSRGGLVAPRLGFVGARLILIETSRSEMNILYVHIGLCLAGVTAIRRLAQKLESEDGLFQHWHRGLRAARVLFYWPIFQYAATEYFRTAAGFVPTSIILQTLQATMDEEGEQIERPFFQLTPGLWR